MAVTHDRNTWTYVFSDILTIGLTKYKIDRVLTCTVMFCLVQLRVACATTSAVCLEQPQ